ncbi:hypothetical protein [Sphingomonas sp.]|uniref:hypothetical protein n=1 Tax=Sphingomonas sp. TaxID=28214 RepID=UPI001DDD9F4F|nr:hypothetical protein [Sphingomonas sp.]MBX9796482.1 hypothetical protein [Sphingomonas sp.]
MSYRPEFEAALRLLARASDAMVALGFERPVLVGGGAVELYSQSAINTGDFDLVTERQAELEDILQALGFVRPSGPGVATRGWIHPGLALGFEIVSSTLLDGLADRDRVLLIDVDDDGVAAILSVEDMIADRMGQFASGTAPEMREQASRLLTLHSDCDRAYLDRRIREETGSDYGLDAL